MLVLWDIDHTLIDGGRMGRACYERAFPVVTGKPLEQMATLAGRTELDIMRETLLRHGIQPDDDILAALAAALTRCHAEAREEMGACGRALPGAAETLAAVACLPGVRQSVLTGNLYEVARIKMEVFGLDRFVDLTCGGFGDDSADRAVLVERARERTVRANGTSYPGERTVLIGDTPNDVRAALVAGARVIGVATGSSNEGTLRAAGATAVVPGLNASPGVAQLLTAWLDGSR